MTLPKASSSLTTGWVAKATPAVAVADGCWVITNWNWLAVTVWMLSVLLTLPKASSSLTTGCVAKGTPAVAVLDGWVVTTNWLAAAGLTTMNVDVAEATPLALVLKLRLSVSATL